MFKKTYSNEKLELAPDKNKHDQCVNGIDATKKKNSRKNSVSNKQSVYARTVHDCIIERNSVDKLDQPYKDKKFSVNRKKIAEKSDHEHGGNVNVNKSVLSDNTKQNFRQAKRVQKCNSNQSDIKNSEDLEQHLQRILQSDDNWEDVDLEVEEFDFVFSATKADFGPGIYEEYGIIPEDMIQQVRSKCLKDKPSTSKNVRSRSDQFDEALLRLFGPGSAYNRKNFILIIDIYHSSH